MGCKQVEVHHHTGVKEHVAGFFGIGVNDTLFGKPTDLFQRSGKTGRIAGELHRGGIGKKFPLARHGRLDHATKEQPGITHHQQCQARCDNPAGISRATAPTATQNHASGQCQQQDTVENANQPNIEAHIAVEDMAELMGDHSL